VVSSRGVAAAFHVARLMIAILLRNRNYRSWSDRADGAPHALWPTSRRSWLSMSAGFAMTGDGRRRTWPIKLG
jgi:hypothetical protein